MLKHRSGITTASACAALLSVLALTHGGRAAADEPGAEALPPASARADLEEPPDGRQIFLSRCPTADAAQAGTLYVANSGPRNPARPLGSIDNPYATIAAGVKAARPGNVIQVSAGTYPESVIISPTTSQAGTATAPIVLRGDPAAPPVIVPSPARVVGSLVALSQPYWILQSLEVNVNGQASFGAQFDRNTYCTQLRDSKLHGGTAGGGVVINEAQNALVDNNEIYDFSKTGTDSHGVVLKNAAREIFIEGNTIHDTSGDSVQCQTEGNRPTSMYIEHNELHDAGENGVDIKGCDYVYVRGNTISRFPNLARYPWQATSSAAEAIVIHDGATNVQIVGNTISAAGRGISVGGTSTVEHPIDILLRANTITDIVNYANRGNGQGIRVVQANGVRVLGNIVARTADAGLRLAADEPLVVTGLVVTDNILRDMRLFVRLGRAQYRPSLVMDRNRYEGASGVFTATGLLTEGQFPAWRAVLAPSLEQNSVRVP